MQPFNFTRDPLETLERTYLNTGGWRIDTSALLRQVCPAATQPFIVPPTWNKAGKYESIQPVWRRAARELRDAENIIVIGYSIPETDQFFRYLYALGTIGSTRIKRFWVFDAHPSPALDERYRSMLGPLARRRYRLIGTPFSSVVDAVATAKSHDHGLQQLSILANKRCCNYSS